MKLTAAEQSNEYGILDFSFEYSYGHHSSIWISLSSNFIIYEKKIMNFTYDCIFVSSEALLMHVYSASFGC